MLKPSLLYALHGALLIGEVFTGTVQVHGLFSADLTFHHGDVLFHAVLKVIWCSVLLLKRGRNFNCTTARMLLGSSFQIMIRIMIDSCYCEVVENSEGKRSALDPVWCRAMSLPLHPCLSCVDLEGLVFMVSAIPSGSYTLSTSSAEVTSDQSRYILGPSVPSSLTFCIRSRSSAVSLHASLSVVACEFPGNACRMCELR